MNKQFYFFIDESGDPNIYGKGKIPLWEKPDFEPILMLGMIVVENRKALRRKIIEFQNRILSDPLFNTIPSLQKPNWFLHASKDHVDVRLKFIEFLREQSEIKCVVVIGRKIPEIFHNKHNGKTSEFYFDLIDKLLSCFDFEKDAECTFYLSQRQSNTVEKFNGALEKALKKQNKQLSHAIFHCSIVRSSDMPENSVVDYYLWVLKRYISKNKEEERRYFTVLENKFVEIIDVYENGGKGIVYNANNPFELSKVRSFEVK
jgi:hypothetical protein